MGSKSKRRNPAINRRAKQSGLSPGTLVHIEGFRDIVSGMLDVYLSSISNRTNAIRKVLTMIATVFIPLTFVAGVYGMNFKHMPEIGWRWGYPAVLVLMSSIAGVMIAYFRSKRWL